MGTMHNSSHYARNVSHHLLFFSKNSSVKDSTIKIHVGLSITIHIRLQKN